MQQTAHRDTQHEKNVNITIIMRTDYIPKDTEIPEKEQYGKDVPRILHYRGFTGSESGIFYSQDRVPRWGPRKKAPVGGLGEKVHRSWKKCKFSVQFQRFPVQNLGLHEAGKSLDGIFVQTYN